MCAKQSRSTTCLLLVPPPPSPTPHPPPRACRRTPPAPVSPCSLHAPARSIIFSTHVHLRRVYAAFTKEGLLHALADSAVNVCKLASPISHARRLPVGYDGSARWVTWKTCDEFLSEKVDRARARVFPTRTFPRAPSGPTYVKPVP